MFELESQRLCLREVAEDDLPDLLPIYLTHTEVMQASNDSQGETMQYDLERLHHDWEQVQSTPGEYMLGIYLKETGEAVGVARYLERNPADGAPWLGTLFIHRAYHRQGLGTEAFNRLVEYFREEKGWTMLRLAVWKYNPSGRAFWQHLGFKIYDPGRDTGQMLCLERQL